ncbi:hypothetical protein BDAP_001255 [Binucleata daphniae]
MILIDKPNIRDGNFVTINNTKNCGVEMREYAPTFKQKTTAYQLNGYKRTIYHENDVKKQLFSNINENSSYVISKKLLNFFYDLYLNDIYHVSSQKKAIIFLYALTMKNNQYFEDLNDTTVFLATSFLKLYLKNANNNIIYRLHDIRKLKKIFSKIINLDLHLSGYLNVKIMQSEIKYVYMLTRNDAISLVTSMLLKIDDSINTNKAVHIFLLFYMNENNLDILKSMTLYKFLVSLVYVVKRLDKSTGKIRFSEVYNLVQVKLNARLSGNSKQLCYVHNTLFLKCYRFLLENYKLEKNVRNLATANKMKSNSLPFRVRIVEMSKKETSKKETNVRKVFVFSPINERINIPNKNEQNKTKKITTKQ